MKLVAVAQEALRRPPAPIEINDSFPNDNRHSPHEDNFWLNSTANLRENSNGIIVLNKTLERITIGFTSENVPWIFEIDKPIIIGPRNNTQVTPDDYLDLMAKVYKLQREQEVGDSPEHKLASSEFSPFWPQIQAYIPSDYHLPFAIPIPLSFTEVDLNGHHSVEEKKVTGRQPDNLAIGGNGVVHIVEITKSPVALVWEPTEKRYIMKKVSKKRQVKEAESAFRRKFDKDRKFPVSLYNGYYRPGDKGMRVTLQAVRKTAQN